MKTLHKGIETEPKPIIEFPAAPGEVVDKTKEQETVHEKKFNWWPIVILVIILAIIALSYFMKSKEQKNGDTK